MSTAAGAPLSLAERATLFSQLAALEQAGVPVDRAFAMLQLLPASQVRIAATSQQIAKGRDLASAGLHSGLFTALDASLLQAAQSAGSPVRVYQRLASHYVQQAQQAKSLRSRLMLPAATLFLALLVQPLPSLLSGTLSLAGYIWGVLWPVLLIGGMFYWLRQRWQRSATPAAGHASLLDVWLLRLPWLGAVDTRRNVRDYVQTLGWLLEAGMPMFSALPKALATLSNSLLREEFLSLQLRVLGGEPLAVAIGALNFPGQPLLRGLITSGEASGTLAASLLSFAERETLALASWQEQLRTCLPRLAYLLVVLWMTYGLLIGGGIVSQMPTELR
jgi:type II secretory pathway component PulF